MTNEPRKISPAPSWVSIFTQHDSLNAPGYVEAFLEAHDTSHHYGWAVMTTRGIAVIKVTDWDEAKRKQPFQWLNTHPKQPASVKETLELAKETAKRYYKNRAQKEGL